MIPLNHIRPNSSIRYMECTDPLLASKLVDLGMLPGSIWILVDKTPFFGPLVMSNGQTHLCIRREDAKSLFMEEK